MSASLQSLAWAHIKEILHLFTEGILVHVVYVAETALTGVHHLEGVCEPLVPAVHLAAAFVAVFVK
jgi:hypothetical protein